MVSQNLDKIAILTKFLTLTIVKIQNFKIHRIAFLYHPKIYLQTKFQNQQTSRFLDQSHFMSKLTIFYKVLFSLHLTIPPSRNNHKIKSNNIWVKYDSILKKKDRAITYIKTKEIENFPYALKRKIVLEAEKVGKKITRKCRSDISAFHLQCEYTLRKVQQLLTNN